MSLIFDSKSANKVNKEKNSQRKKPNVIMLQLTT